MKRNPPRAAVALLNLIVPEEERESIPGDLAEEFAATNRSNLWYWRQVMQSSGYLAWRSFGKSSLGILAGSAVMATGILLIEICARGLLPNFPRVQPLVFAFTLMLLAIGFGSAVVGGYLTTKLSDRADLAVSVISGILFVMIAGFWLIHGIGSTAPTWFRGGLILLILPAALYGRRLRARRGESA